MSSDTTAASLTTADSPPTDLLVRATAFCGIAYFVLLFVNIAFTAEGPNHVVPLAGELARVQSEAVALRWSAVLGLLGSLALAGLMVGLALILARRGSRTAAVITALAGATTLAVWTVSAGALAASSVAAESGFGADAFMGLGILHTTTLLMGFAPAGVAVLAGRRAPLFGRVGAILSVVVGACSLYAVVLLIPLKEEQSSLGLPLIVAFWGIPLWGVGAAFRLLRPRAQPSRVT